MSNLNKSEARVVSTEKESNIRELIEYISENLHISDNLAKRLEAITLNYKYFDGYFNQPDVPKKSEELIHTWTVMTELEILLERISYLNRVLGCSIDQLESTIK